MPIIAPLSDLVGLTRQTSVLAFQLSEVIYPVLPTSAVTMGFLAWLRSLGKMGQMVSAANADSFCLKPAGFNPARADQVGPF
jgi:hypothetical protein